MQVVTTERDLELGMETLTAVVRFEIWFLLGNLALVVVYKMLTGGINMKGLLDDKKELLDDKKDKQTAGFSPARVQLLIWTLFGAGYYLLLTVKDGYPTEFPEVPQELLALVGGGNLVYLGAKARSMLFR